MKKTIYLLVFIFSLFISSNITFSHPGNTDENGGHHCWSNCEKWGLEYGEYHYHDNGYEEMDIVDTYEDENIYFLWDFPIECEHLYFIGTQEEMESCYEISFEYGYDQGYYDYGLMDEFDLSNANKYDYPSYERGYDAGWFDAKESKSSDSVQQILNTIDSEENETIDDNNIETYLFIALIGIAIVILLLIILIRRK